MLSRARSGKSSMDSSSEGSTFSTFTQLLFLGEIMGRVLSSLKTENLRRLVFLSRQNNKEASSWQKARESNLMSLAHEGSGGRERDLERRKKETQERRKKSIR